MSQIKVRDEHGNGIPLVCIRISDGDQPQEAATYDVLVKTDGSTGWPIPGWDNRRRTLYVNVGDYAQPRWSSSKVVMPDDADANGDAEVVLDQMGTWVPMLSRLVGIDASAHRFVTDDGRRQFLRGATMFILYKRYLDGENIEPLLNQLEALGCNMVRMFGMVTSFARWHPQDYGDRYYDDIAPFMNLLAQHGIYGLWTACADTQDIMPSTQQALDHLLRTVDQLTQTQNALFSFVNEQGQHENGIDRQRAYDAVRQHGRIGWMQFDTGSFGSDQKCEPPLGTYAPFHVRRDYPSHTKDCCVLDHPNYVGDRLQVLLDEPDRYGEGGNMNLEQARDSAATAYTSLGFVFHTSQGVQSAGPFSGRTLEMAEVVFQLLKGF